MQNIGRHSINNVISMRKIIQTPVDDKSNQRMRRPNTEMLQALDDIKSNRDIRGPFRSAKEAIEYALREDV